MGGYFNNIGASYQRGECKLSKDRKILQVWDGENWKIYEPTRTLDEGIVICNPECNDIVNKKYYIYNHRDLTWTMIDGLYGGSSGMVFVPYILTDSAPTIGNCAPSTLIKTRYAEVERINLDSNYYGIFQQHK